MRGAGGAHALLQLCGKAILGCSGVHALLCAKGESTCGHNDIRDELHSMASTVHASAETEPEGLIPSHPLLRPADILTGAFHNGRLAAVDVGGICPSAAGAGQDCVVTMDTRKRERMRPHQQELESGGIEYHPFAISCWGRLHPAASQMLHCLAKRKARREGLACERAIFARLLARVTAAVWTRAARMVLQCRGKEDEGESEEVVGDDMTMVRAGSPGTADLPALEAAPAAAHAGAPGAATG